MLPFSLAYVTFADYSPRGNSKESQKSQKLVGRLKRGDPKLLTNLATTVLEREDAAVVRDCLSGSILVPIPRSTPMVPGAIWPSRAICDALLDAGLADGIVEGITRATPVTRSATANAKDRPSPLTHFESLESSFDLLGPQRLVLVDDVLTKGSTSAGCAMRASEGVAEREVSVFSVFRTLGFQPNIERVVNPSSGTVIVHRSGKVFRDDS